MQIGLYTSIADGLREAKVMLAFVSDEVMYFLYCILLKFLINVFLQELLKYSGRIQTLLQIVKYSRGQYLYLQRRAVFPAMFVVLKFIHLFYIKSGRHNKKICSDVTIMWKLNINNLTPVWLSFLLQTKILSYVEVTQLLFCKVDGSIQVPSCTCIMSQGACAVFFSKSSYGLYFVSVSQYPSTTQVLTGSRKQT